MSEKTTKHLTTLERAKLQIFLTKLHETGKLPPTKVAVWTLVAAKGFDCSWTAISSILEALGIEIVSRPIKKAEEKPKSYGRSNRAVAWAVERLAANQSVANLLVINHLVRVTEHQDAKDELQEMFRAMQQNNEEILDVLRSIQSGRKIKSNGASDSDFELKGGEA